MARVGERSSRGRGMGGGRGERLTEGCARLGRQGETKNVTVTTCVTGAFIGYINRFIAYYPTVN